MTLLVKTVCSVGAVRPTRGRKQPLAPKIPAYSQGKNFLGKIRMTAESKRDFPLFASVYSV